MKKLMTTVAVVACALGAFAADQAAKDQDALKRERRAASLAAKGGMVTKPQSGNVVRVLSLQSAVPLADIEAVLRETNKALGSIPVEFAEKKASTNACPFKVAEDALKQPKTANVLLVVKDDKLPTLLCAPENAWAILNVKKLADDFPPAAVLKARAAKELNRAFAFTFASGLSLTQPSVMAPVHSMVDLDAIRTSALDPESLAKIQIANQARGVETVRRATYKRAAIEGWAPPPTNDIQRAILEEVKNPDKKFKKDFPEFSEKK